MADQEQQPNEAAVVEALQRRHRAMVEAGAEQLAALVDRQFPLTHITGCVYRETPGSCESGELPSFFSNTALNAGTTTPSPKP